MRDIIPTCNPNNLQFYGLYLLIKGYLLLNCRLLEPQVYNLHIPLFPTTGGSNCLPLLFGSEHCKNYCALHLW